MDGLVELAEAFLRIVSGGPLDLIVAVHAERYFNIAVASVRGVIARAIDGVTLVCELRVGRILNRPYNELRPEGIAKLFSREQPLILDTSVRWGAQLIPDGEQLSIHAALLSDSVSRAS